MIKKKVLGEIDAHYYMCQFNEYMQYDAFIEDTDANKGFYVYSSNYEGYGTYNASYDYLRSKLLVILFHSICPEMPSVKLDERNDGFSFGCLRDSLENNIEKFLYGGEVIYNDDMYEVKDISILLACLYGDDLEIGELEDLECDENNPEDPFTKPLLQGFKQQFECDLLNPDELNSYEYYDMNSMTSCLAVFYPYESNDLVECSILESISDEFRLCGLAPEYFSIVSLAANCVYTKRKGIIVVTFIGESSDGYGTYSGNHSSLGCIDYSSLISLSYDVTRTLAECAKDTSLEVANAD